MAGPWEAPACAAGRSPARQPAAPGRLSGEYAGCEVAATRRRSPAAPQPAQQHAPSRARQWGRIGSRPTARRRAGRRPARPSPACWPSAPCPAQTLHQGQDQSSSREACITRERTATGRARHRTCGSMPSSRRALAVLVQCAAPPSSAPARAGQLASRTRCLGLRRRPQEGLPVPRTARPARRDCPVVTVVRSGTAMACTSADGAQQMLAVLLRGKSGWADQALCLSSQACTAPSDLQIRAGPGAAWEHCCKTALARCVGQAQAGAA